MCPAKGFSLHVQPARPHLQECRVAYAAQLRVPAACGLGAALARDFTALRVTDDCATLAATGACGVVCVVNMREAIAVPAQSDPSGLLSPGLESAEARCRWGHDDDLGFWRAAEPSYGVSALRTTATDGGGVGAGRGGGSGGGGREGKEKAGQRRSGGRRGSARQSGGRATMTGMRGAGAGASAEVLLDSAGGVTCVAAGARGGWEVRWLPAAATDEDATGGVREEFGVGVLAVDAGGQPYVLTPDALSLLLSTTRLRALGSASDGGERVSTGRSATPHPAEWCSGSRDEGLSMSGGLAAMLAESGGDWMPGAESWVPALLEHVLAFQGLQAAQRLCALNGWRGGATLRVRQLALALAAAAGGGGGAGAVPTGASIAS